VEGEGGDEAAWVDFGVQLDLEVERLVSPGRGLRAAGAWRGRHDGSGWAGGIGWLRDGLKGADGQFSD
jgi:hypothetical protein